MAEDATLGLKVERMCTATTRLQLESDAVPMVMDKNEAVHNKTTSVVMEMKNLKQLDYELEAALRYSNE